jgi:hypothetical protein
MAYIRTIIMRRKWKQKDNIKFLPAVDKQSYNEKWGRTIRLGRHDYKFVWCDELEMDGNRAAGLCDPGDLTIYIDVSFDPIEEVILHEIFHAEMMNMGYRVRTDFDKNLEEMIVDNLGSAIFHNFRLVRKR